jgi:hypothetical protein
MGLTRSSPRHLKYHYLNVQTWCTLEGKENGGGLRLRVKISGKVFLSGQYMGQIYISPSQQACRRGGASACTQWETNFNQQHEMIMQQTRDDGERLRKPGDYLR